MSHSATTREPKSKPSTEAATVTRTHVPAVTEAVTERWRSVEEGAERERALEGSTVSSEESA